MTLQDKIQKLIDSDLTAYRIGKSANVSTATILALRHKKRKVKNLSLETAQRLGDYYDLAYKDK